MSNRRAFTFPGQTFLFIILTVAFLWMCVLGLDAIRHHDKAFVAVSAAFSFFILLIGTVTLVGRSDILIDDEIIARRLFGVTMQTLRWDNVRVVRAFPVGGAGAAQRGINILPKVAVKGNLYPMSKISFVGDPSNKELSSALNHQIKMHSIDVQNSFGSAQGISNLL